MMRRNGASFALFSVGEMGHWTLLFRFSAVLRNVVVTCGPLITPGNCWRKTTWPEFQPSLPPGLGASLAGVTLHGADLAEANLAGANLHGANLTGANLTGATLT